MDTTGSALTQGRVPNHYVDLDLAVALAMGMDAKGKSLQTRWQLESEAMDGELRYAMDMSREETTVVVRRTLEAPGLPRGLSMARDVVPRSTAGATITHADEWTNQRISARIRASSLARSSS